MDSLCEDLNDDESTMRQRRPLVRTCSSGGPLTCFVSPLCGCLRRTVSVVGWWCGDLRRLRG